MKKLNQLIFVSLLIAIEIILTRILVIQTDAIRISLGFIPICLIAMLFGPVTGAIAACTADLLGMLIFPKGLFFPGFTLTATLVGFIYGIFLYNKEKSFLRVLLSVICISIINDVLLNTYFLTVIKGPPFEIQLLGRIIKIVIMFILQLIFVPVLWKQVGERINLQFIQKNKSLKKIN